MALGACGSRPGGGRPGAGTTTITGARIFDGERALDDRVVVLDGPRIRAVGSSVPCGSQVIDAAGATLLPGLIDSHVHTTPEFLVLALRFGVTTELEMGGEQSAETRAAIAGRDDVADYRSAVISVTAQNGHPAQPSRSPKNTTTADATPRPRPPPTQLMRPTWSTSSSPASRTTSRSSRKVPSSVRTACRC